MAKRAKNDLVKVQNRGRGRPTKFDPDKHIPEAISLGLLGATDEQMAAFWGVTPSTLYLWQKQRPEFSEALKEGKIVADQRVAESLFRRACGYKRNVQKVVVGRESGQAQIVSYVAEVPPDTVAAIFWLKNRCRQQWRDRQDHEITGKDGQAVQIEDTIPNPIDVRLLTPKQRDALRDALMASKRLGHSGEAARQEGW